MTRISNGWLTSRSTADDYRRRSHPENAKREVPSSEEMAGEFLPDQATRRETGNVPATVQRCDLASVHDPESSMGEQEPLPT